MVTKQEIADILGIAVTNISDSVFLWAQKQFFILTQLKLAETEKTYTKIIGRSSSYLKLPDIGIKSIDTISLDDTDQDFDSTSIKLNPSTGFFSYGGGFGAGQKVSITYTINAYTHLDIHDYLISLLTLKGLGIFTPQYTNQVKRIKIGRYQKDFGAVDSSSTMYLQNLNCEVTALVNQIVAGNNGIAMGDII